MSERVRLRAVDWRLEAGSDSGGGVACSWSVPYLGIVLMTAGNCCAMLARWARQDVIKDQWTAKWTANAHRLAGTHRHSRAL